LLFLFERLLKRYDRGVSFQSPFSLTDECTSVGITALAKAQQLLLDASERDYIVAQVNLAKGKS
jgi:hypothetical protein